MNKLFTIILVYLLLECRSAPTSIKPSNSDSSIIGLEIKYNLNYYPDLFPKNTLKAFLVRTVNGKIISKKLIESDHRSNNRLYFLNLEPGEYRLAGILGNYQISANSNSGSVSTASSIRLDFKIIVPEEAFEFTKVDLKPSEIKYMGYVYLTTKGFAKDDIQRDLEKKFYSDEEIKEYYQIDFIRDFIYGRTDNDDLEMSEKLKNNFLNNAKQDFKSTDWEYLFN